MRFACIAKSMSFYRKHFVGDFQFNNVSVTEFPPPLEVLGMTWFYNELDLCGSNELLFLVKATEYSTNRLLISWVKGRYVWLL